VRIVFLPLLLFRNTLAISQAQSQIHFVEGLEILVLRPAGWFNPLLVGCFEAGQGFSSLDFAKPAPQVTSLLVAYFGPCHEASFTRDCASPALPSPASSLLPNRGLAAELSSSLILPSNPPSDLFVVAANPQYCRENPPSISLARLLQPHILLGRSSKRQPPESRSIRCCLLGLRGQVIFLHCHDV